MISPYVKNLVAREQRDRALARAEREKVAAAAEVDIKALARWHEHRVQIESQIGKNQIACGNQAGRFRLDRAKMHKQTARILLALGEQAADVAEHPAVAVAKRG